MPVLQQMHHQYGHTNHANNQDNTSRQRVPSRSLVRRASMNEEEDFDAKGEIKEMFFYAIFLTVFTYVTLQGKNDQGRFYFADHLREQLTRVEFPFSASHVEKTFDTMATVADTWFYMKTPFYNTMFTAASFDDDNSYRSASSTVRNRPGFLNGQVRILGAVRLGQLRVKSVPCKVPPALSPGFDEAGNSAAWACYPPYTTANQDTAPFGYPTALFKHRAYPDEPLMSSPLTAVKYDAPTHSVLLPNVDPSRFPSPFNTTGQLNLLSPTSSFSGLPGQVRNISETLEAMDSAKWIDVATRAVMIDINFYNPNVDLVCITRLTVEFMAAGGLVTYVEMQTMRMFEFVTATDYIRGGLEVVVLLFVMGYTVGSVRQIKVIGVRRYLTDLGNLSHAFNLVVFYWVFALRIRALLMLPPAVTADSTEYLNFRSAMVLFIESQELNAFNAFLSWAKVFKYLSFAPQFRVLLDTLRNASGQLGGFSLVIGIVFYGWSVAFMLTFGTRLYSFRNLSTSFYSLLSMALGDFHFQELREISPVMAPLMFILFIVLVVFVVLNMFIAIISDAFADTKREIEMERDIGVTELGSQIIQFFLHGILFQIPLLGSALHTVYRRSHNLAKRMTSKLDALTSPQDTGGDAENQLSAVKEASAAGRESKVPQDISLRLKAMEDALRSNAAMLQRLLEAQQGQPPPALPSHPSARGTAVDPNQGDLSAPGYIAGADSEGDRGVPVTPM